MNMDKTELSNGTSDRLVQKIPLLSQQKLQYDPIEVLQQLRRRQVRVHLRRVNVEWEQEKLRRLSKAKETTRVPITSEDDVVVIPQSQFSPPSQIRLPQVIPGFRGPQLIMKSPQTYSRVVQILQTVQATPTTNQTGLNVVRLQQIVPSQIHAPVSLPFGIQRLPMGGAIFPSSFSRVQIVPSNGILPTQSIVRSPLVFNNPFKVPAPQVSKPSIPKVPVLQKKVPCKIVEKYGKVPVKRVEVVLKNGKKFLLKVPANATQLTIRDKENKPFSAIVDGKIPRVKLHRINVAYECARLKISSKERLKRLKEQRKNYFNNLWQPKWADEELVNSFLVHGHFMADLKYDYCGNLIVDMDLVEPEEIETLPELPSQPEDEEDGMEGLLYPDLQINQGDDPIGLDQLVPKPPPSQPEIQSSGPSRFVPNQQPTFRFIQRSVMEPEMDPLALTPTDFQMPAFTIPNTPILPKLPPLKLAPRLPVPSQAPSMMPSATPTLNAPVLRTQAADLTHRPQVMSGTRCIALPGLQPGDPLRKVIVPSTMPLAPQNGHKQLLRVAQCPHCGPGLLYSMEVLPRHIREVHKPKVVNNEPPVITIS